MQGCVDVTGWAHCDINSTLSNSYVQLLVLISHLIAQRTIVDHLNLFLIVSSYPFIHTSLCPNENTGLPPEAFQLKLILSVFTKSSLYTPVVAKIYQK
jgi:hypothetical protein